MTPLGDVIDEHKDRHDADNDTVRGMVGSGLPHREVKAGTESSAATPGCESNAHAATEVPSDHGIPDHNAHVKSPAAADEAGSGAQVALYVYKDLEGWTVVDRPADSHSDSHSSALVVNEAEERVSKPAANQQQPPDLDQQDLSFHQNIPKKGNRRMFLPVQQLVINSQPSFG